MHKLDKLLMEQEQRDLVASYGIDPTAIETWLQDRERTYRDPTADEALYRVAQWEKRKARQ